MSNWYGYLLQKHPARQCPCRKTCESAPVAEVPKPPKDFAREHRIGSKRHERLQWLEQADITQIPEGPGRDWALSALTLIEETPASDVCGRCARSLLLEHIQGCMLCMSPAEEELFRVLKEQREKA